MSTEMQDTPSALNVPAKDSVILDLSGDGGVMKQILQAGPESQDKFQNPQEGDQVRVLYVGRLAEGTRQEFDQNQDRANPFTFTLGEGQVIKGWDKTVATMRKGEKCLVTLKPEYAYGASGSPPKIPPNSTLEFEIELLGWKSMNALTEDGLVTLKVLEKSKDWKTPKDHWEAHVAYEGRIQATGEVFDKNDQLVFTFGNVKNEQLLPPMFEMAVRKLKKGERALLSLDAAYAKGNQVPENKDIEYTITLTDLLEVDDLLSSEYPGKIFKKCVKEGEGWNRPKENVKVTVRLNGKLDNGTVIYDFEEPTEVIIGNGDLPEALDLALKEMKKGEIAEITAPSEFGWGATLTAEKQIPVDQGFHFRVELVDFEKGKDTWEMDKEEKLNDGLRLKDQGNMFFKDGKLRAAIRKYDAAWKYFQHEPKFEGEWKEKVHKTLTLPCRSNLAQCYLKLGKYSQALESANEALNIEALNLKALYRRAQAHFARNDYDLAEKDCKKILEIDSSSRDASALLKKVNMKLKEQLQKERRIFKSLFEKVRLVDEKELEQVKKDSVRGFDSDSDFEREMAEAKEDANENPDTMIVDEPAVNVAEEVPGN